MTVKEQNELNRKRSTGSMKSADSRGPAEDPLDYVLQAIKDRNAVSEDAGKAQLEGQQTLPEFESQQTLDADSIKKNIGKVSFRMDYLKDPEDALAEYDAPPGAILEYNKKHFQTLVNIAAEQTGADPEQIADKERRTPEQEQLLSEIAGKIQMARFDAFFASRFVDALKHVDTVSGEYEKKYPQSEDLMPPAKVHAVLYFFATHEDILPTEKGTLTDPQRAELLDIFDQIDAYYCDQQDEAGGTIEDTKDLLYSFIESQFPAEEKAERVAAAVEAVEADLPVVQSIIPKNYIMPNNLLMNELLTGDLINTGPYDLSVIKAKGKQKEITSYTMVSYDPGETDVTVTETNLSRHERALTNGIVSLWVEALEQGKRPIFTADQMFRAMPGGGDRASPQQKGAISKAIDKFSKLRIFVNATDEMLKRGIIKEGQTYVFDEYYLNVRRHTVKTENGGTIVQAYEILSQPVMYTYSKLVNQIISIPAKYTEIRRVTKNPKTGELIPGEILAMTIPRQAMTDYILQRIGVMNHDLTKAKEELRSYNYRRKRDKTLEEKTLSDFRKQSNVILFDSLFADAGLSDQTRQSAANNREFVFNVLDYEIVIGNIKGYAAQTKGKKISGVKILLTTQEVQENKKKC